MVTNWQEERPMKEEPMKGGAPESRTVESLLESVAQLEKKNIQLKTNNIKLEEQILLLQKQNVELEQKILVLQKNAGKSSPPSDLAVQLGETRERIGKKTKK